MKLGVCGTGNVASWISGILNELNDPSIELYACATAPGFDCTEFAEKFHYRKKYGSFEELMNDPLVDVVYIAVPNNFHLDMVRKALMAGKNVICEKPLAINENECRQMISLAKESNLFFMEALWAAFLPVKKMVKDIIDAGTIGEVKKGTILQMDNIMFLPRVSSMELGGGYLLDNGSYTIGWMTDYFGTEISNVTGEMRKLETGVDAEDWITVEYADGKLVTIHQAMDIPEKDYQEYAEILGTKGKIRFDTVANPKECKVYDLDGKLISELEIPPQIKNPGIPPVSGYNFEFQAVEKALREGKKECAEASHAKSLAISHVMTEVRKQCELYYPFEGQELYETNIQR